MITYEYECGTCDAHFEVEQSIKDEPFTVCPQCEHDTLYRVINPPLYVKVVGEPTTIGQLAERNAKHMSKEEMDKAQERFKTQKTISRTPDSRLPKSMPIETPKEVHPWMEKSRTKTTKEVQKMTPEQQKRYVQTGS